VTSTPATLADLDGHPAVGVDLGHRDTATADHWLTGLDPAPALACTHLVRSPVPHVACSLVFLGGPPPGLDQLDRLDLDREGARAVLFPGAENMIGELTVEEILASSAIARVEVLGGGAAEGSALVRTNDFVRPQWRDGELVLVTMPAAGDRLVPFETRNPTPCCAAH